MASRLRFIVAAAALAFLSEGALAQGDAWYVAAGGGASFPQDVDATQAGLTLTTELDTGYLITGAFGRTLGNFRAEGEILYNKNDFSDVGVSGLASIPASGDVTTTALMVNGYYDFPTDSKWKPFVGVGIGGANLSINDFSAVGLLVADDDDTVFAFQAKAGVAYEFTETTAGTLNYRFFGTDDGDFTGSTGVPFSADGVRAHVVEIGIRFRF